MKKAEGHLKGIFEGANVKTNYAQDKANMFALMAATLHYFIDIMMDEVDRCGFKGVEFVEKTIFFLRATTPKYHQKKFEDVLTVLQGIKPEIVETEFYYGLTSLRKLTCGSDYDHNEILKQTFNADVIVKEDISKELVFFVTFLLENIINYMTKIRADLKDPNMVNSQVKAMIDEKYDNCVINSVVTFENKHTA
jgi:hypothetical protein